MKKIFTLLNKIFQLLITVLLFFKQVFVTIIVTLDNWFTMKYNLFLEYIHDTWFINREHYKYYIYNVYPQRFKDWRSGFSDGLKNIFKSGFVKVNLLLSITFLIGLSTLSVLKVLFEFKMTFLDWLFVLILIGWAFVIRLFMYVFIQKEDSFNSVKLDEKNIYKSSSYFINKIYTAFSFFKLKWVQIKDLTNKEYLFIQTLCALVVMPCIWIWTVISIKLLFFEDLLFARWGIHIYYKYTPSWYKHALPYKIELCLNTYIPNEYKNYIKSSLDYKLLDSFTENAFSMADLQSKINEVIFQLLKDELVRRGLVFNEGLAQMNPSFISKINSFILINGGYEYVIGLTALALIFGYIGFFIIKNHSDILPNVKFNRPGVRLPERFVRAGRFHSPNYNAPLNADELEVRAQNIDSLMRYWARVSPRIQSRTIDDVLDYGRRLTFDNYIASFRHSLNPNQIETLWREFRATSIANSGNNIINSQPNVSIPFNSGIVLPNNSNSGGMTDSATIIPPINGGPVTGTGVAGPGPVANQSVFSVSEFVQMTKCYRIIVESFVSYLRSVNNVVQNMTNRTTTSISNNNQPDVQQSDVQRDVPESSNRGRVNQNTTPSMVDSNINNENTSVNDDDYIEIDDYTPDPNDPKGKGRVRKIRVPRNRNSEFDETTEICVNGRKLNSEEVRQLFNGDSYYLFDNGSRITIDGQPVSRDYFRAVDNNSRVNYGSPGQGSSSGKRSNRYYNVENEINTTGANETTRVSNRGYMFRPSSSTSQPPFIVRSPQTQFTLDSVFINNNTATTNNDFSDLQLRVPTNYNPTIDGDVVYSRGFTTNEAILANLSSTMPNLSNQNLSQSQTLNNTNTTTNTNGSRIIEMTVEEYYAMTYAVDEVDSGIPMDNENDTVVNVNNSNSTIPVNDDDFMRLEALARETMRSGGHEHWVDVDPKVRNEFERKFEQLLLRKEQELWQSDVTHNNITNTTTTTSNDETTEGYDIPSYNLSEFLRELTAMAGNLSFEEIRCLILTFVKNAGPEHIAELLDFLKRLPAESVQPVLESLRNEVDHYTHYSEDHLDRLTRILSDLSQQQANIVEFTQMTFFSDLVLKFVVFLKNIIINISKYFF